MFAFADMFHFFAHELARLGGSRFAFTLVLARPFDYFVFWHNTLVSPPGAQLDVTRDKIDVYRRN